jgi:hypothetical protein
MGLILPIPVLHLDDLVLTLTTSLSLTSTHLILTCNWVTLTKPKRTLTISSLITANLILTTTWLEVI